MAKNEHPLIYFSPSRREGKLNFRLPDRPFLPMKAPPASGAAASTVKLRVWIKFRAADYCVSWPHMWIFQTRASDQGGSLVLGSWLVSSAKASIKRKLKTSFYYLYRKDGHLQPEPLQIQAFSSEYQPSLGTWGKTKGQQDF